VGDLDHGDDAGVILDFVDDAVVTLTDPVTLPIGQLLAPLRAGIVGKPLDPLQDPRGGPWRRIS